jgi:hypothetical protein
MTEGEKRVLVTAAIAILALVAWEHAAFAQQAPFPQASTWTATNIARPLGTALVCGVGLVSTIAGVPMRWAAGAVGGLTVAINHQAISGALGWG